jgi:hypothetical protein
MRVANGKATGWGCPNGWELICVPVVDQRVTGFNVFSAQESLHMFTSQIRSIFHLFGSKPKSQH